jgi:hypothetical protein
VVVRTTTVPDSQGLQGLQLPCGTQASQPEGHAVSRKILAMAPLFAFLGSVPVQAKPDEMPWVHVSKDKNGFVLEPSGKPFMP